MLLKSTVFFFFFLKIIPLVIAEDVAQQLLHWD